MLYSYEASDKYGAIVRGEFEAPSKALVVSHLERQNLIPISVKERAAPGQVRRMSLGATLFERFTAVDRIFLVRNLAASIRAGLNMLEALDILIADANKKMTRAILQTAKTNLQNGQPLSVTFTQYKKLFPAIFVGMMKAGEASGRLDQTLDELSQYLSRELSLNRRVKSALAYPTLLLTGSIAVIILLVAFIIPRLAKVFRQSKVELPLVTRIMLGIGNVITYSPLLDLLALAGGLWFFFSFRKTPLGSRLWLKFLSKVPVAKDLVKKVALVRFTRTLASLITSGISILDALRLSADSVGNEQYKQAILAAQEQVKNGMPLSAALQERGQLFPRFLTGLILVGEKTGTLEHTLKTFSEFYDEEVDNTLKDLTTYLEPAMLLFIGLVIGAIAFSILLPIYQLVGSFA